MNKSTNEYAVYEVLRQQNSLKRYQDLAQFNWSYQTINTQTRKFNFYDYKLKLTSRKGQSFCSRHICSEDAQSIMLVRMCGFNSQSQSPSFTASAGLNRLSGHAQLEIQAESKRFIHWRTRGQFWKLNQVQLFRDQNERKPIRLLLFNQEHAIVPVRATNFAEVETGLYTAQFSHQQLISQWLKM